MNDINFVEVDLADVTGGRAPAANPAGTACWPEGGGSGNFFVNTAVDPENETFPTKAACEAFLHPNRKPRASKR